MLGFYYIYSFLFAVRTISVYVDGKTEARRVVFVAQGAIRETRGRLQYDFARGYDNGFFKRILRSSFTSGTRYWRILRNSEVEIERNENSVGRTVVWILSNVLTTRSDAERSTKRLINVAISRWLKMSRRRSNIFVILVLILL